MVGGDPPPHFDRFAGEGAYTQDVQDLRFWTSLVSNLPLVFKHVGVYT